MHSLLALPDDGSALDEAAVDVLCFGDGAPPEGEWRGATPLRRTRDAPCAAFDGPGCTCWAAGTVRKMGER